MSNCTVLQTISYKATYPYFGGFSARALSSAYRQYRNSEMFVPVKLYIGKIDANVICNALWREMSFNPVRFGMTSPFILNGRNNIYAFCDGRINPDMTAARDVLQGVKKNLIHFMHMNALPNGQWAATVPSDDGYVYVGHDNKTYAMLAALRDSIKAVAKQNVTDFKNKKGPYRDAIIRAVTVAGASTSVIDANIDEERQDRYMELMESIIDNPSAYGDEIYQQAMAEKERFMAHAASNNQR